MPRKKSKAEIWDETPVEFGVYKNKYGKVAKAFKSVDDKYDWTIDKGKRQRHPLFGIKQRVVLCGTGNYFFWKALQGYTKVEIENAGVTL